MSNITRPYFEDPFENLFRVPAMSSKGSNYPPYNLYHNETEWVIEVALAGFAKDEIEVVIEPKVRRVDKRSLVIKGNSKPREKEQKANYKVRGIALRNFKLPFIIDDEAEIKSASFNDGLLSIVVSSVVNTENSDPIPIPIL